MDLRTQKIYNALQDAFKELLCEKPFEQITVNELCERAQTRRATFYKHFADKYDFMDYMLRQIRTGLIQNAANKLQSDRPNQYYYTLVDLGLDFVQKNKKFLQSVNNNSIIYVMLQTITEETLPSPIDDDELQTQFIIGAFSQCVKWWLFHMNQVSREEIQKRLYQMIDQFFTN